MSFDFNKVATEYSTAQETTRSVRIPPGNHTLILHSVEGRDTQKMGNIVAFNFNVWESNAHGVKHGDSIGEACFIDTARNGNKAKSAQGRMRALVRAIGNIPKEGVTQEQLMAVLHHLIYQNAGKGVKLRCTAVELPKDDGSGTYTQTRFEHVHQDDAAITQSRAWLDGGIASAPPVFEKHQGQQAAPIAQQIAQTPAAQQIAQAPAAQQQWAPPPAAPTAPPQQQWAPPAAPPADPMQQPAWMTTPAQAAPVAPPAPYQPPAAPPQAPAYQPPAWAPPAAPQAPQGPAVPGFLNMPPKY